MRRLGLHLLADKRTDTIILGTFRSVTSLEEGQYYADSRNDFWKLMEQVLNERPTDAHYEAPDSNAAVAWDRPVGCS